MNDKSIQPLTLSPQSESVIKPKPTKREIVDALVEIRLEQIRVQNKAVMERRARLEPLIQQALVRFARDNALKLRPSVSLGIRWASDGNKPSGISVDFKLNFNDLPTDVQSELNEYHDAQPVNIGCTLSDARKIIRKQIEEKLSSKTPTAERVQTMLNDKETRASLETILDNLTGKTIAANASKPQ